MQPESELVKHKNTLFKLPENCRPHDFNILKYKILHLNAVVPTKANTGDAGYDLYACEDVVIPSLLKTCVYFVRELFNNLVSFRFHEEQIKEYQYPECEATKVATGIALEIPEHHVGLIWDRSSVGSKLIKVCGGVIDSTYRGEIKVCLFNLSFYDYHIKAGQKIAQIIIQPFRDYPLVQSNELAVSERGDGGFGSSGK
jgi:dUTP pyrophosphatase